MTVQRGAGNMYAVIATGGKQYRVSEGDRLQIEKLDADVGSEVTFDQVLLIGGGEDDAVRVGAPLVEGGTVTATVEQQGRGDKVQIIKFRRRKHHMKRMGHRQSFTSVRITGITG